MKSRLNYIKPQGALVTVEMSVYSFYYTSRLECPYLPRILLLCLLANFIQHATLSYKMLGGGRGWGVNVFFGGVENSSEILLDSILPFCLHISKF